MFDWFTERRRRRILETPFPEAWRATLQRNMAHFSYLSPEEARHLCELVQIFIAEKSWFGAGGLDLDDEIRVTIAGQACLLVLGLEHVLYANVETIVVYPAAVRPVRTDESIFAAPHIVQDTQPILGEAQQRGPVILTWKAARSGGIHPELGPNVVYHEFAHKLDMLDGAVDGVPPLANRHEYQRWIEVCTREFEALRRAVDRGQATLLDPYALSNVGEFFAVATEAFFDRPLELEAKHPELYRVLHGFYRQDTAARQRRHDGS
jgi:Mlc titration factor MtfA (ptsG expression regulator)